MAAAFITHSAGTAAGAGADRILAVVLIQPVRQVLQIDRLLLRRNRLFDRDGTLAEVAFHSDRMRYDCYVDLGGAALGYLTEPMPVPELAVLRRRLSGAAAPKARASHDRAAHFVLPGRHYRRKRNEKT